MKRRRPARPRPPKSATPVRLPARSTHSTVPRDPLAAFTKPLSGPRKSTVASKGAVPPKRQVARIVDEQESSLLDLIDNLLAKGVMLNADLILSLANVDLVYVRLSALLCAADRVLPHGSEGGLVPPKLRSSEGG